MVRVVIAEKPSVAEDLARVLGATEKKAAWWQNDELRITWAVGHLLELAEPEAYDDTYARWRMKDLPILPETFRTKPISSRGSDKQLAQIVKLLKDTKVEEVVNACDAAREGELIFHRIWEHAGPDAKVSRLWLQAMTDDAILAAWEGRRSGSEFAHLRDAAVSRAEADWLIGMNGTRAATIRLPKPRSDRRPYSVGRVQTATLAMLVEREIEILEHVPEPYWELQADVSAEGQTWMARWQRDQTEQAALEAAATEDERTPPHRHRITEQAEHDRLKAIVEGDVTASTTETAKDKVSRAPLPFDLTTLQKEANRRWRWSASRTLDVAQALYESHKLTTYPRTDSQHLPNEMKDDIGETIDALAAVPDLAPHVERLKADGRQNESRIFATTKVTDHHAIIPTGRVPPAGLKGDPVRLFDLIARRFLAAFHPVAVDRQLTRLTVIEGEHFIARSTQLVTPGWRALFPPGEAKETPWTPLAAAALTDVADGHTSTHDSTVADPRFEEGLTKPVGRLSEAGLLAKMENAGRDVDDDELADAMRDRGLGTPATRADTIETLLSRGYAERLRSGGLRATPRGILLVDTLRRAGVDWLTKAALTGDMEFQLHQVENGEMDRAAYMKELIGRTQGLIAAMDGYQALELYKDEPPLGRCPYSGEEIVESMLTYQVPREIAEGLEQTLTIWKDMNGRYIDRVHATMLLASETNTVEGVHGFVDRDGREYEGNLILEDGRVRVRSGPALVATGGVIEDAETVATCPMCGEGEVMRTEDAFLCTTEGCKLRPIARMLNGRELTTAEMQPYYGEEGRTAVLENFISRRGSPFSATLVRKENGGMDREFPPREARSGAGANLPEFTVVEGTVAICPEHKAEIIETPTHFAAAPGDHQCRMQIARSPSGRELSRAEAAELVTEREVGPWDDFVSKRTGRAFSATLYLKKNEQVGYRFAKR